MGLEAEGVPDLSLLVSVLTPDVLQVESHLYEGSSDVPTSPHSMMLTEVLLSLLEDRVLASQLR